MELTGRRTEVDRITTLAVSPRESALVVIGDPGSGRTSVLDAVTSRVPLPVVRIGVNGSESRWPLAGVTTLFTALDDPRATAHVVRIVSGVRGAVDDAAAPVVAHELLETVRALQLPPTLVLIDDLDRMDRESQALIAFLAGRLVGTALRIVATVQCVPTDGPLASLPSLRLAALAADDALVLARSMAPEDANDGVLAVVAEQTGGNPGALREQLGALRREQLLGSEPLVLPLRPTPTTDRVAVHLLGAAPGHDADVLTRLALAPVTRLTGTEWDRDAVEDLVDAGLVTVRGSAVTVRSPLVRSHLHWRMTARDRRTAHAELATTADPRAAAWHQSHADVPDAVRLLHAARSYAAEGDAASAVALAERALQVGSSAEDEHAALLGVAEVLLAHRMLGLAARYLAAIRPFRSRADDVRRLRLHYSVQYLRGDAVDADELLVPVDRADAGEAEAVSGLLAMVASFQAEAWELDHARDLLRRAEPFAGTMSAHAVEILTAARHMVDAVDGTLPDDRDLYGGLAAGQLVGMSEPALLLLAHALSLAERHRSARRVFALVLVRSAHTAPVWVEAARYLSAENEVRSGNLRQALRAIDAWEAGSVAAERLREPSRAIAIAWRHFLEGRPSEAVAVVDRCLAHRSPSGVWGATAKLHAFRGRVLLLEGRVEEAATALEAADALARSVQNPTVLRHLGDLVEAYVRLDRVDDARAAAARLAGDHHTRPSRWGAIVLARSLALVADDTTRVAARRRALDVFEPTDSQFERARTLAALAVVSTGPERARLGAGAAAAYEAAGLRRPLVAPQDVPTWTTAATVAPARGPVRPGSDIAIGVGSPVRPGTATAGPLAATPLSVPEPTAALTMLTPEERAVVQKVTEGYRNREIATSLYMSQRTVELRLTQIYRKVGARSRSHLVALLG
jgi:DNA-binding CsgD family transcriptional regulator/tetratricopeptide (TPR) repeat protein